MAQAGRQSGLGWDEMISEQTRDDALNGHCAVMGQAWMINQTGVMSQALRCGGNQPQLGIARRGKQSVRSRKSVKCLDSESHQGQEEREVTLASVARRGSWSRVGSWLLAYHPGVGARLSTTVCGQDPRPRVPAPRPPPPPPEGFQPQACPPQCPFDSLWGPTLMPQASPRVCLEIVAF